MGCPVHHLEELEGWMKVFLSHAALLHTIADDIVATTKGESRRTQRQPSGITPVARTRRHRRLVPETRDRDGGVFAASPGSTQRRPSWI